MQWRRILRTSVCSKDRILDLRVLNPSFAFWLCSKDCTIDCLFCLDLAITDLDWEVDPRSEEDFSPSFISVSMRTLVSSCSFCCSRNRWISSATRVWLFRPYLRKSSGPEPLEIAGFSAFSATGSGVLFRGGFSEIERGGYSLLDASTTTTFSLGPSTLSSYVIEANLSIFSGSSTFLSIFEASLKNSGSSKFLKIWYPRSAYCGQFRS